MGYLAAVRTDRKIAGLFAGLVFLALGLATDKPWSALYKEDSVGIALSIGSVALLASGGSRWRIAFGALLAALALLTKQTFIAAGVAGIVWLWARDRKGAATFAAVAAMVVLVPAFVLEITTRAFIANVILANINPVSWTALESNARLLALYQLGPAAIVALYGLNAWQKRLRVQDDLMLLYWLASIAPLAGLSKVGSNYNYWIEFAASTAVVATGAIWSPVSPFSSWALGARAAAPLLLLTAQLAVLAPRAPIGVLPRLRAELSAREAYSRDFNVLVNTVRNEPGDVLANPLDVVVLANRSLLLEPFVFSALRRQGRWDATDMVQRICARQFTLLILSDPLERPDFVYQGYRVWPEPVYAALQKIMILDGQQADRYLYRPGNRSVCS